MKNISLPIVLFLASFVVLVFPTGVLASGNSGDGHTNECTPVYGGGSQCPKTGVVIVDKKVMNPSTSQFVDNLTADDPKYHPEDIITFRIGLRNSGEDTVSKVTVKDIFPIVNNQPVIDFMSGPGEYDRDSNTMTFTVSNLTHDNEQTFEVKGRIRHASALPVNTVICPDPGNRIEAKVEGQEHPETDEATFCIVKNQEQTTQPPAVAVMPPTGPHDWQLVLGGLVLSFGLGHILRKTSSSSLSTF